MTTVNAVSVSKFLGKNFTRNTSHAGRIRGWAVESGGFKVGSSVDGLIVVGYVLRDSEKFRANTNPLEIQQSMLRNMLSKLATEGYNCELRGTQMLISSKN
jgi:hypothetical protein